jgi:hypothetical protein
MANLVPDVVDNLARGAFYDVNVGTACVENARAHMLLGR